MRYEVKWGEVVQVVVAANEADAWAAFCKENQLATQHPRLYKRSFKAAPVVDTSTVVKAAPKVAKAAAADK